MSSPKIRIPNDHNVFIDAAPPNGSKDALHCPIGRKGIKFNAVALASFNLTSWEPVLYDAMLVAASVEFCDHSCRRPIYCWSRTFDVSIPLHEPSRWSDQPVKTALERTLRFLTGDTWRFHFSKLVPDIGAPDTLNFAQTYPHVMAFSDGVDSKSVAGLYPKNDLVKVRVGGPAKGRPKGEPFSAIPFDVSVDNSRESSARSRGFKFSMISGLAAYLSNSKSVIVPESGQGALGPVLAELDRIYPDYRNHPAFFRKMEIFLKVLLGRDIRYEQPRLWSTKGETVSAYLQTDQANKERLLETRSCWQTRFNVRLDKKLRQCGLCSACLLRRLSFHSAGLEEAPGTYVWEDLRPDAYGLATPEGMRATKSMVEYGIAGAQHLDQLARVHEYGDLTDSLSGHACEIAIATGSAEGATRKAIDSLLEHHHAEWTNFKKDLGDASFVRAWAGDTQ
ncbi:7-cyano-7-deazaguanine synthase [Marinicauda sp. Alg238-R41]|uniref:7-cyano-7-deazaguanine synthase n=1 Tax=Marinicauda sp. Alg238-R41 TaxID=2993447 RepID=UPI0022E78AC2|nr:7-cyano-7-deazaguanine synthase [Marinicauda sp. Alg238-R41]